MRRQRNFRFFRFHWGARCVRKHARHSLIIFFPAPVAPLPILRHVSRSAAVDAADIFVYVAFRSDARRAQITSITNSSKSRRRRRQQQTTSSKWTSTRARPSRTRVVRDLYFHDPRRSRRPSAMRQSFQLRTYFIIHGHKVLCPDNAQTHRFCIISLN